MSGADARVVYLGLDAFDAGVAAGLVAAGELPTLAKLLEEGASVSTESPAGVFVTAQYATMFTGRDPARHGYLCWKHFAAQSYEDIENTPDIIDGQPFWDALADAGQRLAILDVPHTRAPADGSGFNGTMLVEWGCHDRHFGTHSYPSSMVSELNSRFGAHPIGTLPPPRPGFDQFAACDYHHRAGRHRTPEENKALWDDIVAGHARKRAASLHVLAEGPWDLFMVVFGESHCTGHQLWSVHDPSHPWHSASSLSLLGGDPLVSIYRQMDETLGVHLASLGPDTTVFVNLSHGMGPHYDGTHLLDDVLRRLAVAEVAAAPSGLAAARLRARGLASTAFGALHRRCGPTVAGALRKALARPGTPPDDGPDPDPRSGGDRADRPWFAIPNNTVSGAIRLNLIGREPRGVLLPGVDASASCERLTRWLMELVNVDTGEPVVLAVRRVDDIYDRSPSDAFPDLFVEWNRNAPIERVWSPRIGLVERQSGHWRTGDHTPQGLLVARGPGIVPGRRPGSVPVVDVGVTVAAACGVTLSGVDGRPIDFLLPSSTASPASPASPAPAGVAPATDGSSRPATGRGGRRSRAKGVLTDRLTARVSHLAGRLDLLGDAHHMTRAQADAAVVMAERAVRWIDSHEKRLLGVAERVEQLSAIKAVTSWIEAVDVPESLLVSVVLPTRDRSAFVPRAIASVLAQTYTRWELLVVDDGSVDDTPSVLAGYASDERIRVLRTEGVTLPSARNVALEAATGDVFGYLDDDNTFDPGWFKAVVWAFEQRPDVDVLYAARVIDDVSRVERIGAGAMPSIHFEPYDRARLEQNNIADMGVIAHRAKLPEAHFDPRLETHADWDIFARLTAEKPPLQLPVIALYYASDTPNRLSDGPLSDLDLVRSKFH